MDRSPLVDDHIGFIEEVDAHFVILPETVWSLFVLISDLIFQSQGLDVNQRHPDHRNVRLGSNGPRHGCAAMIQLSVGPRDGEKAKEAEKSIFHVDSAIVVLDNTKIRS